MTLSLLRKNRKMHLVLKNRAVILLLSFISLYSFTITETTGIIDFYSAGEEVMPVEGELLPTGAIVITGEEDSYITLVHQKATIILYPESEIRAFQDSISSTVLVKKGKILLIDSTNHITVINDSTIIDTKGALFISTTDSTQTEVTQIQGISMIKVPQRERAELLQKGYHISILNKGFGKRRFADSSEATLNCDYIPCEFGEYVECDGCAPIDPLDTIDFTILPLLTIHPFSIYGRGVSEIEATTIPRQVTQQLRLGGISDAQWVSTIDYTKLQPTKDTTGNDSAVVEPRELFILDGLIKGDKKGNISLHITLYSNTKQELLLEKTLPIKKVPIEKYFITTIRELIAEALEKYTLSL